MAKTLADFVREAQARVRGISVEEFDEMIENHDDVLVVDVREPEEFHHGHIPGALLIPRGVLESAVDAANDRGTEQLRAARERSIVVCSHNDARSTLAADVLLQMGFKKVYALAGGIKRWEAEGFALVSD
jgi:rhodanese-related sulfurtransferase